MSDFFAFRWMLYAKLLIVVFRINDSLSDIRSLAIWTAERLLQVEAA